MDLLDRARQLLQSWAPTEPPRSQYYNVACAQGHRLQGLRTGGYQALRCPTCGEGMFVLPASPLPDPPRPPERARSSPARSQPAIVEEGPIALEDPPPMVGEPPPPDEADGEIEWMEPAPEPIPVPAAPRAVAPAAKRRPAPAPSRPKPAAGRRPAPDEIEDRPQVVDDRPSLGERLRRRRPVLIVLALVPLVLATVGYRLRWQRQQNLPGVVEKGRSEGLPALDEGRFDAAKRLLGDASRAVDALGGAVEGADEIRQGALEAAIFADLVPATLEQIVDQGAATADGPRRFESLYKGRSIVVRARVTSVPESGGYDLDYRIFVGNGPAPARVGRLDLDGFRWIELDKPKVGDELLFGARLDSVQLDEASNEWLIRLDPESGVTIKHFRALEALNWPPPSALKGEGDNGP